MIKAPVLKISIELLMGNIEKVSELLEIVVAKQVGDGQYHDEGSGSRGGLLPPSLLRTARASFPASSSSLSNALWRTRSCQGHGLHNTHLEPLYPPVHCLPVDGVPGSFECGECTSRLNRCHLPSLPKRLIKLSCDERPDGRLPAFAWGDVEVSPTTSPWAQSLSPHYRAAFAFSILSCPHLHALKASPPTCPCDLLSRLGDVRGDHVPLP